MPIYQYRCTNGHEEEALLIHSGDKEPGACAECGAPLARGFSPPVIRYRAAGFYSTDYKAKPLPKGFGEKW